jgi:hypothetical protein
MSDQLVAETATYMTHNKHKRRTSMPSKGLETEVPAIKGSQVYGLMCTRPRAHNQIHTQYIILIAFPRQQWLRERASVLRYMCIVCLVLNIVSHIGLATCIRYRAG